ncbi:MAG: adenosylmethionine--8-amino-7-oxononanoate transaminase [Thermodesulfobacteriota bacterium]|nr:adenosylmethionine--8-amino-7-oxononanoate transaminase [Thermodesulfobacteriota bacterium]
MSLNLQEKDKKNLWHPYTQMKDYSQRDLLIVDRAEGIYLFDENGRRYFDTISSWWCILHGHNHPTMKEYVRRQLEKLDHIILAGISHESVILLAEKLVDITPEPLSKVFFSDNGSTTCEIALKMSLQFWRHSGQPQRNRFVSVLGGYHGDTIGAMSLGGVPEFHEEFKDLLFESFSIPSPHCYRCPMGKEQDSCELECLQPLEDLLDREGQRIAAMILEPLIQGAGGLRIYPVRYLKRVAELVRQHGVHLILDEVATGFGRTGKMFAMEHAGVVPDFLCLSKGLTGGMLPMAATMTTDEIYNAFYDDYVENKTFYHGHTFTGNPLAAAAGLGSLQVFADDRPFDRMKQTIPHLHQCMERFRDLPWVGDVRKLGMICALELVKNRETKEAFSFGDRVGWKIYLEGLKKGLILRPLGNIVYLWLPLSTTMEQIDEITELTYQVLSDPANINGWPG